MVVYLIPALKSLRNIIYCFGNNIQMTADIVFVWVIGTIYQPFFLMKINFNKKTFESWKITVDDFYWYVLADVKKNATIIAISVIPERCEVTIYKELPFRKTVAEFCFRYHENINKTFY